MKTEDEDQKCGLTIEEKIDDSIPGRAKIKQFQYLLNNAVTSPPPENSKLGVH